MRISVERLRVLLLVGVALLAILIAGFLGYARYRAHRFMAALPVRLGVDITRETNGFTYSQSLGGKTIYTLHASKAVEHRNGTLTLHEVSMILYGRKQNRMDRISGSQFEYDQKAGIIRAQGEVHIDLEAPAAAQPHENDSSASGAADTRGVAHGDKRIIHLRTSGLVYRQKPGVAETDQPLEFQFGGITGEAKGAEYNSQTGVLILDSQVKADGIEHGRSVVLTASHAELDRTGNLATLTDAKYLSPGQSARADHARITMRPDGSPDHILGQGNVVLQGIRTGTVSAPQGELFLTPDSRPRVAHLTQGVHFQSMEEDREATGTSNEATLQFDTQGQAQQVILTGGVHANDRFGNAQTDKAHWSDREFSGGSVQLALAPDSSGHPALRTADATGSARLVLVSFPGGPKPSRSEIAADTLHAEFQPFGTTQQLSNLRGSGHTSLIRSAPDGAHQASSGDTLEASFRPAMHGSSGAVEIARAVQSGHVKIETVAAPKAGEKSPPEPLRASSDLASYNGDTEALTLTGHAQLDEAESTLWANTVVLQRRSGDAIATGNVKANYLEAGSADPVHGIADHARLEHATSRVLFYGTSHTPARMWRGASQVEAPVLELERQQRRLTAHGDTAGAGAPVHAVFSSPPSASASSHGHRSHNGAVVRIASRTMIYFDTSRQADFDGGIRVEDADGVLTGEQATVYLQPASALQPASTGAAPASKTSAIKTSGSSTAFFEGSVERIVATGKIRMEQPGRRAEGDRLVYTASDGTFTLTGTASAPPRLIDEQQGVVTGKALSFKTGDNTVMVTGGAETPGQRAHTVTRVRQK